MSKFENEQEKKVREILREALFNVNTQNFRLISKLNEYIDHYIEDIMLRIRPYLKVQKKWRCDLNIIEELKEYRKKHLDIMDYCALYDLDEIIKKLDPTYKNPYQLKLEKKREVMPSDL